MPKPKLTGAFFTDRLPADMSEGAQIPPGAMGKEMIVEMAETIPDDATPVNFFFFLFFVGVFKRHRVTCKIFDPSGALEWKLSLRSPKSLLKGDPDSPWTLIFGAEIEPKPAPRTYTIIAILDGERICERNIEFVPLVEPKH